jgi:hypothetical protein
VIRRAERLLLGVTVLGELLAGFAWGKREAKNRQELRQFLDDRRVETPPVGMAHFRQRPLDCGHLPGAWGGAVLDGTIREPEAAGTVEHDPVPGGSGPGLELEQQRGVTSAGAAAGGGHLDEGSIRVEVRLRRWGSVFKTPWRRASGWSDSAPSPGSELARMECLNVAVSKAQLSALLARVEGARRW